MNIRKANYEEKNYFYNFMKKEDRWITYWNKNDLMCVIESNGKIIGFVREVIFTNENISTVGNVWIDEKYRGDKIGLKLISYLIENINKDFIWLDCAPELSGYYGKLGFKEVSSFPEGFLDEEELKEVIPMKLNKKNFIKFCS